MENTQKCALCFVLNDYESNYKELIDKVEVPRINTMTLNLLATEVYEYENNLNPRYLNETFTLENSHTTYAMPLFKKEGSPLQPNMVSNRFEITELN